MYTSPSELTAPSIVPHILSVTITAIAANRRHLYPPPVHLVCCILVLLLSPWLVLSQYPPLSVFPTLSSLTPPTRPIAALDPIAVNGTGFTSSSQCRFTNATGVLVETAAVYESSSAVQCPLPSIALRSVGDQLTVQISASGSSYYSLSSLYFQFTASLTLASFSPETGTSDGGTLVTVVGGSFTQSALMSCRFNDTTVVATIFYSSTTIGCYTPTPGSPSASQAYPVNVDVSDNGQDWVPVADQFVYLPPLTLVSVSPPSGPTAYTTLVTVSIQPSPLPFPVYCRVGRHVVIGAFVGSDVVCETPSTSYVGNQTLLVSYDPLHFYSTSLHPALNFTYYTMPAITTAVPALALTEAATTVNLTLTPALNNSAPSIACLFNGVDSGVGILGGSWLTCVAPPLTGAGVNVSSNVAVSLLLDGQHSTNDVYFTYTPRPYLFAVHPSSYCNDQQQTLYVFGAAFVPSSALSCLFVDSNGVHTTVAATFLSDSALTCTTPLSSLYTSSSLLLVVTNSPTSAVYSSSVSLAVSTPLTVLSSIEPTVGSTALPFYFLLSGSGFTPLHHCSVDLTPFPLTYYSSTTAACETGDVTLSSSLNSTAAVVRVIDPYGNTTVSWAAFTYGPNMRVTSVAAEVGVWSGGTVVQVSGSGFMAGCMCQWSIDGNLVNTAVSAFTATSVSCPTPDASAIVNSASAYPLMAPLSIATTYFASNPIAFTFLTPATITALSPSMGVVSHNTTVTVYGAGFLPTNPPLLSLSTAYVVQSMYLSAEAVLIRLVGAVWQANFSGEGSGLYRLIGISVLGLRLAVASTDGLSVLATPLNYTLYNASAFTSITPTAGPVTGSSLTTVGYSSPLPTTSLVCRFDAEDVLPTTVSASSLSCASPSHVAGQVTVRLSINGGIDWEVVGQYTYLPAISVTALSPQYATGAGAVLNVTGSGLSASGYGVTAYYNASGAVTQSTCTSVSSSLLQCTLPILSAATYMLSLSNNGGYDVYASALAVTVVPSLAVTSLSPWSGPTTGGTHVILEGSGFPQTVPLWCAFSTTVVVPALYLSSTMLLCISHVSTSASDVSVEVGVNTQQWTADGNVFAYYSPPTLTSFTPVAGPAEGGTYVTLIGSDFLGLSTLHCTFDSQSVAAEYVDSATVVCVSPPLLSLGNVTLGVAINAADYVYADSMYEYYPPPTVTSLAPSFVPAGSATTLTLAGSGFNVSSLDVVCGFNSTAGQLTAITSASIGFTAVTCPSPVAASATNYRVLLSLNGGSNWLDTGLYLHTYIPALLFSTSPAAVSVSGNVLLTVSGDGFVSNPAIVCSTGGTITSATYINSTTMFCLAPYSASTGTVSLSLVTTDGLSYSSDSLSLTYQPVTTVLSVSPSAVLSTGGTLNFNASWVDPSLLLYCLFPPSSSVVSAVVLTNATFACTTPPLQPTTAASVRILSSYQTTIDYTFTFTTVLPPAVLNVSPSSGQLAGGTLVTVSGVNLLSPAACQFVLGGVASVVSASAASSTQLLCITPTFTTAGLATVQVNTLPASTYTTSSTATFYYLPAPVLSSVTLPTVPLTGGVLITVVGSGFIDSATLQCGFNVTGSSSMPLLSAPAIARGSTFIECMVPSVADTTNASTTAELLVSINGVEWYSSALTITYLPPMQLTAASFAFPLSDAPLLSIHGQSLLSFPVAPTLTLRCAFGCGSEERSTAATVYTDTLLQCSAVVPPAFDDQSLTCILRVTDGVFSSTAALSVTFYQTPIVASLSSVLLSPSALLTVLGASFPPSPLCVFGFSDLLAGVADAASFATVVSSFELTCSVPSSVTINITTPYYVRISSAEFISTASATTLPFLPLLVVPPATVDSASSTPTSSYPSVLTFSLSNTDGSYVNSGLLSCLDQSENTWPAVWLNASSVLCVLPAADFYMRSSFTLYVTNDGVTLSGGIVVEPPPLPVVLSVEPVAPSTASLLQATLDVLTLTGQYFQPWSTISCVLGGLYLPATYVNTTAITCNLTAQALSLLAQVNTASLPAVESSAVGMAVTNDGVQLSLPSAAVFFLRTPVTSSITPTHADPSATTTLTVVGAHFTTSSRCAFCPHDDAASSCQFASAVWSSSALVHCTVPATTAGRWMVSVVNDASTSPLVPISSTFLTLSAITLSTVSLLYGPATGGTSVTVVGSGFMPPPSVSWCVFDLTASVMLTSTETMYATAALYLNETALSCTTPAHSVGSVTLDVLIDQQLSSPPLSFNFTYSLLALSLSPTYASLTDTLNVTVWFDYTLAAYLAVAGPSPSLYCSWDGLAVSPFTVVNSTVGECAAVVRWVESGYVSQLSVVDERRLYVTPALPFTVLPLLAVTSFTPSVGPLAGGVLLTVTGSGFASLPAAPLCWFNFTTSAAVTVESDTHLTCVVPAATFAGPVPIQLSTTPAGIYTLPLPFLYLPVPTLSAAQSPGYVNTSLLVTGSSFYASSSLACQYASSTVVSATYYSPTAVDCPVPLLYGVSTNTTVTVSVTNDGYTYSPSLTFQYLVVPLNTPATLTSISPATSPTSGGVTVTVSGIGFTDTADLVCRFDATVVAALYVNDSAVACVAPAYAAGVASLAVANDGQNYCAVQLTITYIAWPVIGGVVASFGSGGQLLLTVTGTSFSSGAVCAFVSNSTLYYPYITSAELPHLPAPFLSSPVSIASATQLTCAAPPLSAFYSPTNAAYGAFTSLTSLSSLTNTVVSLAILPTLASPYVQAYPFTYHSLATPSITSLASNAYTSSATNWRIDVFGSNFIDSASLACRLTVVASLYQPLSVEWLSPTRLLCYAAAAGALVPVNGSGVLGVTNDGWTWVAAPQPVVFYSTLSIDRLSPASVPLTTLLLLTVASNTTWPGVNSFASPVCRVAGALYEAVHVNSSAAQCAIPAAPLVTFTSAVPVQLSLDGSAWSNALMLQPLVLATISSIYPTSLSVTGGTVLTVQGSGFTNSTLCVVQFDVNSNNGEQTLAASAVTVVSSSTLLCTLPAFPSLYPQRARVEVYNDASQLAMSYPLSSSFVTYTAAATATFFSPIYGPAVSVSASVVLTVVGSGFQPLPTLACRFISTSTPALNVTVTAVYSNSTIVHCSIALLQPFNLTYIVQLTTDGLSYLTPASSTFTFIPPPVLSSVSPTVVDWSMTALVTVTGSSLFSMSPVLPTYCVFNEQLLVLATLVNASALMCTLPAASMLVNASTLVAVDVQLGSSVRSLVSKQVQYVPSPLLLLLSPSLGAQAGGTTVTIAGVHLLPMAGSSTLYVLLNSTTTSTSTLTAVVSRSSTSITYTMPAWPAADQVLVGVLIRPTDTPTSLLTFTYLTPPTLTTLSPSTALYHGGSIVTVVGSPIPLVDIACLVGPLVSVPAVRVDSSHIECVMPLLYANAHVNVSLLLGSLVGSSNALPFLAAPLNLIASSTPSPSSALLTLSVGQWLSFNLSVVNANQSLTCRFDGTVVVLAVLSTVTSTGSCRLSALNHIGRTNVTVEVLDELSAVIYSSSFLYQPLTVLTATSLSASLARGGDTLTLSGSHLQYQQLTCSFTNGVHTANSSIGVLNDTTAACTVPPWPAAATVTLQVWSAMPLPSLAAAANAGGLLWSSVWQYYATFSITSLTPSTIIATSVTLLTVIGSSFPVGGVAVYCNFASTLSPAWVQSSSSLTCAVPLLASIPPAALSSGSSSASSSLIANISVSVQLGALTTADTTSPLPLLMSASPYFSSVSPAAAAPLSAFTYTLNGGGFISTINFTCILTPSTTAVSPVPNIYRLSATYVNATTLVCSVPPMRPGQYNVSAVAGAGGETAVACLSGGVVCALTMQVVSPAAVSTVWPRLVSSAGGTVVTVTGSLFSAPCACRWNNLTTSTATVTNSTTLTCPSPSSAVMGVTAGQVVSFALACSPLSSLYVDAQLSLTTFVSPTVSSVYPTAGVTSLTSPLYIYGTSFQPTAALACRFNQSSTVVTLPALYLSSSLVLCLPLSSPSSAASAPYSAGGVGAGSVGVGVTVNGVDYSVVSVVFSTYAVAPLSAGPILLAVSPAVASGEGGELLTVTGSGLSVLASASTSCVFGLLTAAATVVSDTVLTCQAPAVNYAHTVNFSVSCNGGVDGLPTQVDPLNSSIPFTFLPSPAVFSVFPASAPTSGGSVLTVTGQSFLPAATCQLDSQPLTSVWQSSTVLLCTTAPTASVGTVVLQVSNVPSYFPPASNRTLGRIAFTLYTQPIVTAVSPSVAPSNGNATVTVSFTAAAATASTLLHCQFGGVSSPLPALWVDSQHVRCVAPSHAPGVVSVDVTLNGQDYTNSAVDSPTVNFTFVPTVAPILTSVRPSVVPASGDSYLVVSGYSLTPAAGTTAYCVFGALGTMTAFAINDTTIACLSPPGAVNSSVAISLLLTPPQYVSTVVTAAAVRLYFGSPSVLAVSPAWVSTAGTTTVTVVGGGFSGLVGPVQCVFRGAVSTSASVMSDGLLSCTAPSFTLLSLPSVFPSVVGLTVSWAAGSLLADGYVSVSYSAVPTLTSLYPTVGLSTMLTITGSGFYPSPQLSCRVGSMVVAANYSSSTTLYCNAPRQPPATYNVSASINSIDWSGLLLSYTVLYDWNVLSITPRISGLPGGTLLTVTGDYFLPTSQLACLFTPPGTSMAATYINSTTLTCPTPPANVLGDVSVQVTVDGRNYSDAAEATLTYAAASYVSAFSPVSGYAGIATTITITGQHFIDSPLLALMVDNLTISSVTFVSASSIVASLPAYGVSTVAITVLPNNEASIAINFTFLPLPVLSLITPARVVQSLAGDSVRLDGYNFSLVNGLDLVCLFGALLPTVLTFIAPTSVSCVVPTALSPGVVNVSLVLRSNPSVRISVNWLLFTYDADMAVVSYSPTSGALSSYTVLTIRGTGFINSSLTQCRFGSVYSVPATVLSATLLRCNIPPRFTFIAPDLSLYVDVLLTGNGQDFIALAPSFRFLLPTDCQPGTVCPPVFSASTSIVACPAGSYCPGTDSALLCPAGTFQLYPAQSSCLPCPPAFYCPTAGLTMPLLCPAGSLCSSMSIINPYMTPCSAGHFCLAGSILAEPLVAHTADTVSSAIGAARQLLSVVDAAGPNTTDASDGLTAVISHLQLFGAFSLGYNNSALYNQLAAALASDSSVHVASQCKKGYYCLPGTATPYTVNADDSVTLNTSLLSPVPCFPGYLCPSASLSPIGSAACPRAYYCPTPVLALPCPVGSYCPGETLEPIPCPASTYNNLTAQPACSVCPTGYYCPVASLLAPIVCPAGYVCDQSSLITPASECPAGYWCGAGMTTANTSSLLLTAPKACNASYFCLSGVASPVPLLGNFATPQLCTSGTYCLPTASAITGSASCSQGTYCPPGSAAIVVVSVGYFVNFNGATIQYQCLPGTFAPNMGASTCLPCPAGYSCNTVGADVASICAAGLYKSINDTICEPCPRGTFSQEVGLPDGSLCQPCLAGYVCGQEGLIGMTGATLCVEGYVCGDGTTAASQYDNPCPLGFVCGPGTTPATEYQLLCPAGFTCSGGVALSEENRSACRKGYYCPPGVYNQDVTGYTLAVECVVEQSSDVIDDFSCGASLITVARPYGVPYIRPVGQCPLGTTSLISAKHLDECYLDPSWTYGAVWEFSPIDTAAVPVPAGGRIDGLCPYGYACPDNLTALNSEVTTVSGYHLRSTELVQLYIGHMDYTVVTLSWANISTNLTYDTEFELYVYSGLVQDSNGAPATIPLPFSFTSSDISQHATLRLAFTCLVNTTISLSVGILHGLYLPQAADFVNSGTVSIIQPDRAITNTRATFMTVYDFLGRSLFQPTNIPPLDTELEYGYQLSSVTLDHTVDLIVDSSAEQIAEDITQAMANLGMSVFALPYLPFFSNCRGYDSYINMYVAFQDKSRCTLVDTADIVAVGNFDFLSTPNSDSCNIVTDCLFEEDMSEVTSFPRWFDKSADQNTMFYMAQSPFDQSLLDGLPISGYPDLANYYAPQLGTDSLVAVIVNRDQNAPTDAFPRQVVLAIEYQQTDEHTKKIVTASVTLADFDTTLSNTAYNLTITLTPLGYFGLVNEFVFDETIFTIIYLIIGALTIGFIGVLWLVHRNFTRLHFPPAFRLFSYFDIMFPAAIGAFMLWVGFPLFICVLLYILFVVPTSPLFASVSGNVASDLGNSMFDSSQVSFYAAGRIGCVLLSMGLASMWAGARMFIPTRRKRKQQKRDPTATTDDKIDPAATKKTRWDDDTAEADDDDLSLGQHDVYWTPKTWKRSNFLLVSVFTDLALLVAIEFSYSNLFNQNQWYVIIAFKVAEIPINYMLRLTLQESLLTMPMQVMVDLVQFMITIGASNFVNFIFGFAVQDVALKYFERIWKDDIVDYCIERLESVTKRWEKLTTTTAEEEAEQAEKEEKRVTSGPFAYLWGASKPKGESDSESDKEMVAPVLNSHETSEEILAPIVEFYSDYSAKVISLFFSPLLMYFLYLFRNATQMTVGWGIAQHDMYFYFLFICVLLPFMMLLDIVLVNIKELCHFWKLYDYLMYLRFRFEHRTEWWHMHTASSPSLSEEKGKGKQINRAVSGDTMDMAMPRAWRSLDHMCFSGQYYFMLLVHTGGMVFLLIALEVFIHNNYNPFNDLLGLTLFAATTVACYLCEKATLLLAHSLPLWPLQPRRARVYMEQQYRGDTGIIPSWEREYGAAIEALKESEWYSVEGMRTLGFKQRWLRMNKEWVMDELMSIWQGSNGAAKDKAKDGDGGGDRMWLSEWESREGKEAMLKQIARALGLEENWDRPEDDDTEVLSGIDSGLLSPPAASGKTYRANAKSSRRHNEVQPEIEDEVADDHNVSEREDDGADDQMFSPVTQRRSGLKHEPEQQSTATTTSAAKHRKHLLALSYRYFLAHLPPLCSHCSTPATDTQPLVFVLSFPLSTVMRRFYARRRRQAAVTARANGHQRLNREMIYERVSREQWAQWLDQELEWAAACTDCAAKERVKRRQGEVTVFDVKKEMERTHRRKLRKKKAGRDVSDDSDDDDEQAEQAAAAMPPSHTGQREGRISDDDGDERDGLQADTAAYWHPPQRDGVATARPHDMAGEYSVSASSVHADERWHQDESQPTMAADVKEFLVQWMNKAQAVLDRREAVQRHDEQLLDAHSHSRAASVSGISISADSQASHRRSISSDSGSGDDSVSQQLHRENVEHGLVGLGRMDISSDSDSDNDGAPAQVGSRRPSITEGVTREEDDYTGGVSRQQE